MWLTCLEAVGEVALNGLSPTRKLSRNRFLSTHQLGLAANLFMAVHFRRAKTGLSIQTIQTESHSPDLEVRHRCHQRRSERMQLSRAVTVDVTSQPLLAYLQIMAFI